MSQLMRNILVWLAISGITFVAIQNIYNQSPSQNMNYSEFVSLVNKDQISQVSFKGDGYTIEGITQEGNSFTTTRPIYVQDDQKNYLENILLEKNLLLQDIYLLDISLYSKVQSYFQSR